MKYNKCLLTLAVCLMATLGATAQSESTNTLWNTTGPAVLEHGSLQWQNEVGYWYGNDIFGDAVAQPQNVDSHTGRVRTTLRYGLGMKSELQVGVGGELTAYTGDTSSTGHTWQPTAALRVNLYEGRGWLPQLTLRASVGGVFTSQENYFQSSLTLEGRSRLGDRWALEYELGYDWNPYDLGYLQSNRVHFGLFASWMARPDLKVSAGLTDKRGEVSVLYKATPALQLVCRADMSGGWGGTYVQPAMTGHLTLGLNWMIR